MDGGAWENIGVNPIHWLYFEVSLRPSSIHRSRHDLPNIRQDRYLRNCCWW